MLMRLEVTDAEVDAMRAMGPPREYLPANQPLVKLIEELARHEDRAFIQVEKPGLTVTFRK
jgi:hypothetical protein